MRASRAGHPHHLRVIGTAGSARRRATLCGAVVLASLAAAVPAQAAGLPDAVTGPATAVSYSTATLTGTVNPHGRETSYYFQYGATKTFGGQTAIADAGAGSGATKVSLPITGLQPLTVYFYRLVAVNSVGPTIGHTRMLTTTKVPLSLAILSTPNPVLYAGTATVQGTLSGTNNASREVVLQANLFPFTAGFQDVGNPELTTASGSFSFPVMDMALVTRFRVVTTTNPAVISPEALENVAVQVTADLKGTKRAHFARFFGTVTPAEDGAQVGILKIEHGHGVLVGGTSLKHSSATRSSYSRVVHVTRGVYRVLVRVTSGAQISNYSRPLTIG